MPQQLGRTLLLIGAVLIVLGAILSFSGKIPFLGKLPGDIYIKKNDFSFYFPITTSILLSIVISLILILIRKK